MFWTQAADPVLRCRAPNGDFSSHGSKRPLQLHNLARANRRVKKLEWDDNLAREAESYAQTLSHSGVLQHSSIGSEGENLFVSSGDASFEDAVNSWLHEEKKYRGEHIGEGNLAHWGHFSQCVWHSTTHLGMGKARSKSGHTYIVRRINERDVVEIWLSIISCCCSLANNVINLGRTLRAKGKR